MPRIQDRLVQLDRSHFVGRAQEKALFQRAICAPEAPFAVLYIYGPGGVGKTSLLKTLHACCEEEGAAVVYLDARTLEVTPAGFTNAWNEATRDMTTSRRVVLIDTYDTMASLDSWLREEFLPQLSDDTLVVLAGRNAPNIGWRTGAGWQELCRVWALRNLAPEESRAFLNGRHVPAAQHDAILNFTHGHPLALALVADLVAQRTDLDLSGDAPPDVVNILLQQFVQDVPSPEHRAALEVCALVHVLTERLLSDLLEMPDVYALFQWLRGLSFTQATDEGIFLHDLAREVLSADLRWRNPDGYTRLHRRARDYYEGRFQQTPPSQKQQILFDYIYLHRHSEIVRPFFDWRGHSDYFADTLRPGDTEELLAMTQEKEGAESAHLLAFWLARQPESVLIFREATHGAVAGWMMTLPMHRLSAEETTYDPALRIAFDYLKKHSPLEPGDRALFFRFWMARDTYQGVSHIQNLVFVNAVRQYLSGEDLTFTFFPCANAAFWSPIFHFAEVPRIEEVDYTIGGTTYGVFCHDWRIMPPASWLTLLTDRAMEAFDGSAPDKPAEQLVVLSKPEFETAVKRALRQFTQPDRLRTNPLLRSRLVIERVGTEESTARRIETLQNVIREIAAPLLNSPRDAKLYRALDLTFFHPAPSQEKAADQLDVSYATFRRHLASGTERLAEALWQKEIGRA